MNDNIAIKRPCRLGIGSGLVTSVAGAQVCPGDVSCGHGEQRRFELQVQISTFELKT